MAFQQFSDPDDNKKGKKLPIIPHMLEGEAQFFPKKVLITLWPTLLSLNFLHPLEKLALSAVFLICVQIICQRVQRRPRAQLWQKVKQPKTHITGNKFFPLWHFPGLIQLLCFSLIFGGYPSPGSVMIECWRIEFGQLRAFCFYFLVFFGHKTLFANFLMLNWKIFEGLLKLLWKQLGINKGSRSFHTWQRKFIVWKLEDQLHLNCENKNNILSILTFSKTKLKI